MTIQQQLAALFCGKLQGIIMTAAVALALVPRQLKTTLRVLYHLPTQTAKLKTLLYHTVPQIQKSIFPIRPPKDI